MDKVTPKLLENEYVRLEPLDESHRWQLQSAVAQTSHDMWKYMMKDPLADFDGWFTSVMEAHAGGKQRVFVVFDKGSGKAVGCSCFSNIEEGHERLEIGSTWYVPSAHGTAVNPASKLALMSYAFEEAHVNRLELKCDALNARSRRAIAKLGATEEGTLREHMKVPDGNGGTRLRDTVYFSILASEWPQVKQGLQQRLTTLAAQPPEKPAREAGSARTP